MRIERELMRGAGPAAVLHLLEQREMYGYALVEALARQSDGVLAMRQSTVYPLLYNLEAKGFIRSRAGESDSGRVRRYYALTPKGRKELVSLRAQWRAVGRAMSLLGVLDPLPKPSTG